MISFDLSSASSVLCIGAHPDDIEIGCGGTLLQWSDQGRISELRWFVGSGDARREAEQRASAAGYFQRFGTGELNIAGFPDNRFPTMYAEIKQALVDLSRRIKPDVIFTHRLEDRHQDHRLLAELTWNVWRDALILEYEIPKWEGDLGQPQVYCEVSAENQTTKLRWLREHHRSQTEKDWFDDELFSGLMRLRGAECRSHSRFAEAFTVRKATVAFGASNQRLGSTG
ncbi:MAG: PIG-L family deacetylase [Planctomycetales bacterium]|nr:PIG-L family deacetylase [Planctomycetales bacterium]